MSIYKTYTICAILLLSVLAAGCSDETVSSNKNYDSESAVNRLGTEMNHLQISGELSQVLTAPDATEDARFGTSIAVDKNTVVIGAPFHTNENDVQTGAAYIFTNVKSQWQYETTLFPDVEQTGIFGRQVAVANGVIAVAGENTVYVFEQKGKSWDLVSKLEPEDEDPRDQFGASLAVEGKYIAVGDPDFRDFGSVAIFNSQGKDWQFSERLFASNSSVADGFGRDVSFSRTTLLSSSSLVNAGYVFERKGKSWNSPEILEPNDPLPAGFGFSVSLSGKTAVIGRPLTGAGAAYIFEKSQNSWIQVKKLVDPAGNEEDRLGQSVAIDKKLIVVGAPGLLTAPGKAYYVNKQGENWGDLVPLESDGVQAGDQFGISVAVSLNTIMVGAPGDDEEANNAGKVYVRLFN